MSTRTRPFRGRDLRGAELHGFDLRGVDLSGSRLQNADLSDVRTGHTPRFTIKVAVLSTALSVSVGVGGGYAAGYVRSLFSEPDPRYRVAAGFIAVSTAMFLALLLWKGFGTTIRNFVLATIGLAALLGVIGVVSGQGSGAAAATAILFIVLSIAVVVLGALARAMAGAAAAWVFYFTALGGAIAARGAGGGFLVSAISVVSALMVRRALRGDLRYRALASLIGAFGRMRGTSFRGADLRGATFRGARLENCDFRDSTVRPSQLSDARRVVLCTFDARAS